MEIFKSEIVKMWIQDKFSLKKNLYEDVFKGEIAVEQCAKEKYETNKSIQNF